MAELHVHVGDGEEHRTRRVEERRVAETVEGEPRVPALVGLHARRAEPREAPPFAVGDGARLAPLHEEPWGVPAVALPAVARRATAALVAAVRRLDLLVDAPVRRARRLEELDEVGLVVTRGHVHPAGRGA